jgi:hypothetical protein
VPAEHQHRGEEDGRVEQFLAHALGHRGNRAGRGGDTERAQHATDDPATDPKAATRRATARRHDDADDQRRFQHLAKNDDRGRQHRVAPFTSPPGGRLPPG